MTRFARAQGSKSSNSRVPESATSWHEMKQTMTDNRKSQSSEEATQHSIKTPGKETDKNVKWSEIPDMNLKVTNSKLDKQIKTPKSDKKSKKNQPFKVEETTINSDVSPKRKVKKSQDDSNKSSEEKLNKNQQSSEIKEAEVAKAAKRKVKNSDGEVNQDKSKFGRSAKKPKLNTPITQKCKDNKKKRAKNSEYNRRKPHNESNKTFINGNEVDITYYDGFPIKSSDAERLTQLQKEMISRGVPRSEVTKALKLERRKAEKALAREKKKVCFNCRQSGHTLSECPQLKNAANSEECGTGICFKCGSTEHTHFECKVQRGDNFKFAQCFICREQGHIARQCPDNSRGLYPKGGACRVCGDVTHLKKDCPKFQSEQEEQRMVVDTIDNQDIESLGNETVKITKKSKNANKIIKF